MVSSISGPIPPHPYFDKTGSVAKDLPVPRVRPEGQPYAAQAAGSVGMLLQIEGQRIPSASHKPSEYHKTMYLYCASTQLCLLTRGPRTLALCLTPATGVTNGNFLQTYFIHVVTYGLDPLQDIRLQNLSDLEFDLLRSLKVKCECH